MLRGDYNKFEFARRLNADSIDFAYENIKDIPHKTLVNWKTDIKDIINEIIE